jgi:hypothetical protein
METSYDQYKEFQKTIRAIISRYKIKLKENNNFADKGELIYRSEAYLKFYFEIEKEILKEQEKALEKRKGLPGFPDFKINIKYYTIRKCREFYEKNHPDNNPA